MLIQRDNQSVYAIGAYFMLGGLSAAAFTTTSLISSILQNSITIAQASPYISKSSDVFSTSPTEGTNTESAYSTLSYTSHIHRIGTFPANLSSATSQSNKSESDFLTVMETVTPSKHISDVDVGAVGGPLHGHDNTKQRLDDIVKDSTITSYQSLATHRTLLNGSHDLPTITQKPYPEFILPTKITHNQTHECKAWGPLCQTGSTVVSVRAHNTVFTSTVPCSSYLSAQAYTIRHDKVSLSSWRSHFGRSPQCTSYAEYEQNANLAIKPDWMASCEDQGSTLPDIDVYPPGIYEEGGLNGTERCCGPCAIFVPRVSLRYFPQDPDVPCGKDVDEVRSSMVTAAPSLVEARTSLFVTDGFTYTSPSLYFEIRGTASFMDDCGQLGVKHVSSTLAIPPGVMSTVSFDVPVGAELPRGTRASKLRHLAPLKTRDLACPTWGVNMPVATGEAQDVKIAYPFYPLLVPPPELIAIDTAWSKCFKNHWPLRFGIFDPPRALTANSVMVASSNISPTPQPDSFSLSSNAPSMVASQLVPTPAAIPLPHAPQATPTAIEEGTSGLDSLEQGPSQSNSYAVPRPSGAPVEASNGYFDLASSLEKDLEFANSPSTLDKTTSNNNDLQSLSANVQYQGFKFGETAYPALPASHVMTIGAVTYTEGADCSCYSLASNKLLHPGDSITMGDGLVVFLAPNGASAVIDGTTQQLSPAITGVAPAFAGVLNESKVTQAKAVSGGSAIPINTAKKAATMVAQSLKATTTISANNFIMTARLATGSNELVVLGGTEGAIATLVPGGTDFTLTRGKVISLGTDDVLNLNGKAIASMSSVLPTRDGKIGAAVATAFHMGLDKANSYDAVGTSEAQVLNRPIQNSQVKTLIPWLGIFLVFCTYIIFIQS